MCMFVCSVLRDTKDRGRDLDQVLNQYIKFVKPAFEEFTLPVRGCGFSLRGVAYNDLYVFFID